MRACCCLRSFLLCSFVFQFVKTPKQSEALIEKLAQKISVVHQTQTADAQQQPPPAAARSSGSLLLSTKDTAFAVTALSKLPKSPSGAQSGPSSGQCVCLASACLSVYFRALVFVVLQSPQTEKALRKLSAVWEALRLAASSDAHSPQNQKSGGAAMLLEMCKRIAARVNRRSERPVEATAVESVIESTTTTPSVRKRRSSARPSHRAERETLYESQLLSLCESVSLSVCVFSVYSLHRRNPRLTRRR